MLASKIDFRKFKPMIIAIKDDVQTALATSGAAHAGTGNSNHLREALAMFADELSAHRYLERLLWPNGVYCPYCGSTKIGELNGASTRLGTRKCYGCRKMFSILHGTFMSGSHVPAHKWLQAIYLSDCGTRPVRPHHLQQILDVSYKTACSMLRRIGEMADSLSPAPTTSAPSLAPRAPAPSDGFSPVEIEMG
jgi:transposase-like protein